MVLLLLQRMHVKLNRDVIFLAEAGEEGTPACRDRLHGEGALAGDRRRVRAWPKAGLRSRRMGQGRITCWSRLRRRSPRGMRLVAHGTGRTRFAARDGERGGAPGGGGGARRHVADADAAERYHARIFRAAWRRFRRRKQAARYRDILDPARAAEVDRYFREHEPGHYSILRTSRGADDHQYRIPLQRDSLRRRGRCSTCARCPTRT